MERIVRSATQGPGQRTQPRERRRSRVNRKSRESEHLLDKWPNLLLRANSNNTMTASQTFFPLCLFLPSLPVGTVRRTLKNGLTTEEANALGLSSGSEMQVWSGPKDTLKLLPCPKWQPSPLRPIVMSWAHLFFFLFGLYQASWREWSLFMNWQGRDSRKGAPHSTSTFAG